ncbi:MFS transporter [Schauerella aestuarii]|uniref:MFS transporter n=1 Tax=Schauerella aestuarii TaxID=2511204 RepID=UPI001928F8F4|nr:MFS transporter [Achromobacter aestuarii]
MSSSSESVGLRNVLLLGMAQILVWGGSFFLLAVMADPIVKEMGWANQWVYGALSLGIFISGLLAPRIGQLISTHGGRPVLTASGLVCALGLVLMALSHSLPMFLLAWVVLGIAMAAGLYDPLFAALGQRYGIKARAAITGVTLVAGFCTTITWPVIALLIEHFGWRNACIVYASILAVAVWPLYANALPERAPAEKIPLNASARNAAATIDKRVYVLVATSFTIAAIITTAMSVQLIVLLQASGYGLAAAIGIGALLGPSQVASRLLETAIKNAHPVWTAVASAALTLLGLLVLVTTPAWATLAIVVFGAGNGLRAIVRGTLPLALVSAADYPKLMGKVARPALIGQAATPFFGGFLIDQFGAGAALWTLSALCLANVALTLMIWRRIRQP